MPRGGTWPEYDCSAIREADLPACRAFVEAEAEAELYDLSHYAGLPISHILHAIDEGGGWLLEDDSAIRGIALAPVLHNQMLLLPLPMIHRSAMNRGLQCLLHAIQLTAGLHFLAPKDNLAAIALDHLQDRPPSPEAIRNFGLCAVLPEAHEDLVNLPCSGVRRYLVAPELLPGVARDLVQFVGRRRVRTHGAAGRAWIYFPASFSPMREGKRWLLDQIAAGRLSVIGLPDLPDERRA